MCQACDTQNQYQASAPTAYADRACANLTQCKTDGTEYQTRSTYGAEGDRLVLDIDSKSHPAWTGGDGKLMDCGGRVSRFKDKFKGFV